MPPLRGRHDPAERDYFDAAQSLAAPPVELALPTLNRAEPSLMPMPNWKSKPTLVGDRVILRPFTQDDADVMAAILCDPDVLKLTGSVSSTAELTDQPRAATAALRDWYGSRTAAEERVDLAVIDRSTGVLVGEVVLNEFEGDTRAMNFRTLIGPTGRGKGLGTEAARLIIGYGFDNLGLHRISLDVYAFNPRARRVYEKVGFVTEGVKRDAFIFDGEYTDEVWMSILEDEWTAHRGNPA